MGIAHGGSPAETGLLERARLAFFASFLPVLLAAIAVSEWVIVARALARVGMAAPAGAHVLIPLAFFAVNRMLLRGLRAGGGGFLASGYAAFAFTCLFGGLFVAAAELAWATARLGGVPAVRAAGLVPDIAGRGWRHLYELLVDGGVAGIGLLFLFGYTVGRRALAVTSLRVGVRGLPASFAGFRLVHLSDLHIGAFLGRDELRAHVERVNALAPDLICITGDLVDRVDTCAAGFPVLAGLRAPHGVVVTLGNHDFAAGADAVTAALRSLTPFTVLRNERMDVSRGGARLAVIGVDDLGRDWARGVDEHPALPPLARGVPRGQPLVVLSHRPDCFEQAAELGASLVLSGHTHGGQIGLPSLFARRVRNPAELITAYARGVFVRDRATLVVSNGLGFTGQRVRLFTPREIGCIELWPA